MFKVRGSISKGYVIIDEYGMCLHSNSQVFFVVPEYWPTRDVAQKFLNGFQYPNSRHVWEHGDVFKDEEGSIIICLFDYAEQQLYSYYLTNKISRSKRGGINLDKVKFFFNIKEKIDGSTTG